MTLIRLIQFLILNITSEQSGQVKQESMRRSLVMSKKFQLVRLFFGVLGLTLQFFTFAAAQEMNVTLSIDEKRPYELTVTGSFKQERPLNESHVLAFAENVAGIVLPAERISKPYARDDQGNALQLVTTPRCCIALGKIVDFSYIVDLRSTYRLRDAAHVSWLKDQTGVLMLGDLLPQEFKPTGKIRNATVNLELPNGWKHFSTARQGPSGTLVISDLDNSAIFVGTGWRSSQFEVERNRFTVVTGGVFQFSYDEIDSRSRAILLDYSRLFGELSGGNYLIAVYRPNLAAGEWAADTRGRTALIATTEMPFKSQTLQQLDEQLRHELFHFWIPNGVSLSGRYDWFYEGFALYSSLRLAVRSNTIRFDDMLDTLGRALSVESSTGLIQLTKERYSGSERELYAKGLAFAFLCDLALNISSKGKRSSDTLVRELYQTFSDRAERTDGNEAVLKLLDSYPELRPIVGQYVTETQGRQDKKLIDAASLFDNSGLDLTTSNGLTKLSVRSKLNSRQKAILDKLGYNSWRKLVKDSK